MRVSTAFNKLLGVVGATVASVTFTPTGIVVGLRQRRSKVVCPCGWRTLAVYDRHIRPWRHLDLAGSKLWLEAEIRGLHVAELARGEREMARTCPYELRVTAGLVRKAGHAENPVAGGEAGNPAPTVSTAPAMSHPTVNGGGPI